MQQDQEERSVEKINSLQFQLTNSLEELKITKEKFTDYQSLLKQLNQVKL